MYKNEIDINELNKLYDEIYYSNYDEVELGLDIITSLISEKEYQEFVFSPRDMEDIKEIILDLYNEVIELFDDEGLSKIRDFASDIRDRISNREMDEVIENEYKKYLEENYDESLVNKDEYYEDNYNEDDEVENDEY